ncbi:MAG: tetratricopeptide repeat protein, partial [Planctomycetia bacterium]|nr:tetratricopeptide repeat protein [Planctomycetia bacterium]
PKLRASALNHLKIAAAQLPDVIEAQARYGVALILSQELSLGRQYLQAALRKGETEPQYQIWAAWSVVQAGYPEEAEPIVNHLLAELAQGRVPRELEGTLHLLGGEIHQARRTPEELRKALAAYERSYSGKVPPAGVQLRMAQIEVQLGQGEQALRRIEALRAGGQGGTAAEHLAVLTLLDLKRTKEAGEALAAARRRYPESEELVGLEAALLIKNEKPKEADRVLAEYLEREPDRVGVVLSRAQILTDLLDNPRDARKLLTAVADQTENSAPMVQLALLDLRQKDYGAVASTIAKIRSRWKEAAAADLLDAQLSLERGELAEAVGHFDEALKKDPGNKLVQFWKAQIDGRLGSSNEAAQAFESLARDGATKQLDSGLTLAVAAKSALANLALQNNDLDGAIRRFEGLRTAGDLGGLERGDRWQLVAAYAAKGQWALARKEIASLLNDTKNPPSTDERVRAANYYRQNKEDAAAVSQLDYVLRTEPGHPSAVVSRAFMLWESKKNDQAIALIRKAIATPGKEKPPAVLFLMLAALENDAPPASDASNRAMTALDQGLTAQPRALDLVQAKYRLLAITKGPQAATAYVESEAKDDTKGTTARLLAEVYREQKNYPEAENTLRGLVEKNPRDAGLAASLVRVVSTQAIRAGEANDRD